jgi:hypothetical protein
LDRASTDWNTPCRTISPPEMVTAIGIPLMPQ